MIARILKRIAVALAVCVVAAWLTGFIYAGFDVDLHWQVWKTAVLWYINLAILFPGIHWIASKVSLDRMSKSLFVVIHLASGCSVAFLWTVMAFLDLQINPDPYTRRYLNTMYAQYFNIGLFVYAAVAGWIYILQYQRAAQEQLVREAELQRLAREAELRALRAQINPHFLFNALNSVNALVGKDPEGAREMNTRLGNILRYVLDGSEKQFVTLREELSFVNDYLRIEKLRLGDKLTIVVDVDEGLKDERIPPMTLEPIVENAIKHGIARHAHGGTIEIGVMRKAGAIECRIHDTGDGRHGIHKETMLDRGVGLRNTLERLKLHYADAFTFRVENAEPSGCTVTLSIPARNGE
jgi:LytS/YehU family sensor histidine kinase